MTSPEPVLLLDRASVGSLLTIDACIAAVEAAFASHARGRSLAPQLSHVEAPGGEFHIKAGGLAGPSPYFACMINAGFFGNRANLGLPNIIGLIVLANATSGSPLAIMESGYVTRLRTGAATAVAARYLARPNSRIVTVCGAGVQAGIQVRSLSRVLALERVFVWSRSDPTAFARELAQALDLDVRPATDLASACRQSDVIVTCTPAKRAFLRAEHVAAGTFIAAVGADSPEKQELEPALLASSAVVCDLTAQCVKVGELHHAIAAGLMTAERVRGEIGEIITGTAPARLDDDEIIVFDSTGTALQDAAAAVAVYENAIGLDRVSRFDFWAGS